MPEVVALRTFRSKYGPVKTGQRFNAEPKYAQDLRRNKLIRIVPDEAPGPGPQKDRSIPGAPQRGGKEGGKGATPPAPTAPQRMAGGEGHTLSSAQAGQASARRTSKSSAAGGRRGSPTPRGKTESSENDAPQTDE